MLHIVRPDGAILRIRNLTDQVYSLEDEISGWQFHWSVSEGMEKARARGELQTISLKEMGVTVARIRAHYDGIDDEYALTTDLTRPLLFVPYREKCHLIDGWHRLLHAALAGVDTLFAYFLTEEEAEDCLVCKLPPGTGVDWGQRANSASPLPASTPTEQTSETAAKRRQPIKHRR